MINLNHFTNRLLTNVDFLASNKEDAFIISKHLQIGRSKLLSHKPNTLLIGCAGSGKSRTHFSPNIELGNTSMIVLDPAGEYLYQYKTNLEQKGFHIYKIDLP